MVKPDPTPGFSLHRLPHPPSPGPSGFPGKWTLRPRPTEVRGVGVGGSYCRGSLGPLAEGRPEWATQLGSAGVETETPCPPLRSWLRRGAGLRTGISSKYTGDTLWGIHSAAAKSHTRGDFGAPRQQQRAPPWPSLDPWGARVLLETTRSAPRSPRGLPPASSSSSPVLSPA